LKQLLNFQRTFLIRFEGIAEVPWKDQRWGAPFVEKVRLTYSLLLFWLLTIILQELDFLVYEPYCGNYNAAMSVMLSIEPDLAVRPDWCRQGVTLT
jgi:cell division control protein 24